MNFSRKLLSLVFTITVSMIFALNAATADTIKIGIAGVHSGDLASYGLPTLRAAEFVVSEINAKGGLLGKRVELLAENDACKPEIATHAARRLINRGARVILGHTCTAATKAALPIYTDANVIVISPSATATDLTMSGRYPTFYRTMPSNYAQAAAIVAFTVNMLEKEGLRKKIAILHDKGDYGEGIAEDAGSIIQKDRLADIVLFEGVTPGAVDYSEIVRKVRRTGAHAVIFGGYHPEASKIVTQMRRSKMNTRFVSDDGVKDEEFIKVAGKFAEGVYAAGLVDISANPLTKAHRRAYADTYGAEPGPFFDNAVAAAIALTNAIEMASSTDTEAITRALHDRAFETPFGLIKFDRHGDAIGVGFSMYMVKNGQFVQIQ